jgi:raffinose/stachyose/melibiose transport system permease protein
MDHTLKKSLNGTKIIKGIMIVLFSVLIVTQLYPLVWLVLFSLKTNKEIMAGSFFSLPEVAQWSNFKIAYEAGHYIRSLLNSLFVSGTTMIFVILFSSMIAFAISRFRWRLGPTILTVFLLGMMIPMTTTLLPIMLIFKQIGVLNTYLALILPYIAFCMPVAVFILSGFMRGIPHEIEESAMMDGAGVFRTFAGIILPISVPSIVTVVILTFISTWNEYIMAATFISSQYMRTIPFGVYVFIGQYSINYGVIGAFLVMGALPVVLIYFFLSDKITKGMVDGAVKG